MTYTPISTLEYLDHEVELITQSSLEENSTTQSIPIELETDPRKIKVLTVSENAPEPPNVTPTRILRAQ